MPTRAANLRGVAISLVGLLAATFVLAVALHSHVRRLQRHELFAEIQPVEIEDCGMQRFGVDSDGGYLLCGNLLDGVEVAYSYGISGRDSWGCDVSTAHELMVHQYDCFNTNRPVCSGGRFSFHAECIGDRTETIESRAFDTLAHQVADNGDKDKHLVVKLDVEGAEWDSLLSTPASVFHTVDQLVVEFHRVDDPRYLAVIRQLKNHFHLANLHFNNAACREDLGPFTAWAFEVLFVNKQIAKDIPGSAAPVPHPLDRPNMAAVDDCQPSKSRPS
jgi:hypothetical protein